MNVTDLPNEIIEGSLNDEEWREYVWPARFMSPYRIVDPVRLYYKLGGTTHRILDIEGVVHCVPSVGVNGCVLRWKPRKGANPVAF